MSTAQPDFFVYLTKTYVSSGKWDVRHGKIPFDSVTCVKKLTKSIAKVSNFSGSMKGGAGL